MARGGRVRERKPHVERDQAGLRPESEEREQEHGIARMGRQRRRGAAEVRESGGRRARRHEQEGRHQQHQPPVGHGQIPEAGLAGLPLIGFGQDQEVGGDRHQLPEEQERDDVVGERDETQGEQEEIQHGPEQAQGVSPLVDAGIGPAKERAGDGNDLHDHEEECAQAVEMQADAARHREQLRDLEPERRTRDQRVEAQHEPGGAAHDRPQRREAAGARAGRGQESAAGPGDMAEDHGQEERQGQRHAYRREERADRRSSAARIPRRMSAGSGGHPATKTSTGTIWSTLPATA